MDTKKVFYLLIVLGIISNLYNIRPTSKYQEVDQNKELDISVILLECN